MKQARTVGPLKEHMCNKNHWDQQQFDNIDWICHSRALKRHENHRITMVKYLQDWLPVGKQVHRYNRKSNPACPSCPCTLETRDHVMRCPARQQWRNQCLDAIQKEMEQVHHSTCHHLTALMLAGVATVLTPGGNLQAIPAHPSVQHVAKAQEEIGWEQILKGRFAMEWRQHQRQHKGPEVEGKKDSVQSWMTSIINTIFEQFWEVWTLRNGDKHGTDAASRAQVEKAQAIRELEIFYDKQELAPNRYQWLFVQPIAERMTWNTAQLRQWLNSWAPVLEKYHATDLETG